MVVGKEVVRGERSQLPRLRGLAHGAGAQAGQARGADQRANRAPRTQDAAHGDQLLPPRARAAAVEAGRDTAAPRRPARRLLADAPADRRPAARGAAPPESRHLAHLILIGVYTGTRPGAI